MGILLAYDITNVKSFENIKAWIKDIEQHSLANVEVIILGNKCDMEDKRKITKSRASSSRRSTTSSSWRSRR